MATKDDIIPSSDADFDTLQAILVAAVALNAVAWGIPAGEITKLTDKQTIWDAAWLIAKDKLNSTVAQKTAKTLARNNYEKKLRPFIQKWIYRNELMDASDIEECGLLPHDASHTPATKPDAVTVTVKHGQWEELISSCSSVPKAIFGCIVTEGAPLPPWLTITPDGKIVFIKGSDPVPQYDSIRIDLTTQRVKHFTGLTRGSTYYFYYWVVNAAGVSPLSEPTMVVC